MLLRRLFGLTRNDAHPAARRLPPESAAAEARLLRIGEAFLLGYHRALEGAGSVELCREIEAQVESGWRGFGHEGAGLGLALRDAFVPRMRRRSRLRSHLAGAGAPFRHVVLAGAGWSLARLPWATGRRLARLDPLLGPLVFDGLGFQRAFFSWSRTVRAGRVPRRLPAYARRVFDVGVGRCLWFGHGLEPDRIGRSIEALAAPRREFLWSGVGLAATYAGGATEDRVRALRRRAGEHAPDLAQGAAFGALVRVETREPTEDAELTCRIVCGVGLEAAAGRVEAIREGLPARRSGAAAEPVYEVWRRRTRATFAEPVGS